MSAPALAINARGRTDDQRIFVTDGCLILREDALGALAGAYIAAAEVRELTAEQMGRALSTPPQSFTLLDALVPSRVYTDVFRTGDDVALGARYVGAGTQLRCCIRGARTDAAEGGAGPSAPRRLGGPGRAGGRRSIGVDPLRCPAGEP